MSDKTEIFLRKDSNPDRKAMRSILREVIEDSKEIEKAEISQRTALRLTGILLVIAVLIFLMVGCSMASTVIKEDNIAGYSLNQWCKAIYIAEGGEKTRHPYGILATYKHTTPLQACKNTVKHKYANWKKEGRKGAFVDYLGAKYCPIGCDNDNGTNKNWVKNVSYWLKRGN